MKPKILYKTGFVYNRDAFYISAVIEELEIKDVHHTAMLRWMDGKWDRWMVKKRLVSHCVYNLSGGRSIFSAAIDGSIQVGNANGFRWEHVDSSDEGPNGLRRIRGMRRIGESLYLVGMSRMVYRRSLEKADWHRLDQGVRVPRSSKEIAGFSAIGGYDEDDVYAVGMGGEIWRFDGKGWSFVDSGTNIGLYDIQGVDSDTIYVCGDVGTLLVGKGIAWEHVTNNVTTDCFWSMTFFKGQLYIATDQGEIFTVENNEVVQVDTGIEHQITTFFLHSSTEILLSVGSGNILTFDGKKWREIYFKP